MSWPTSDLYANSGAKSAPASTNDMVSAEGAVQSESTLSWLTLVILFFVFRVIYEMGK
jgi:hypothetical protein